MKKFRGLQSLTIAKWLLISLALILLLSMIGGAFMLGDTNTAFSLLDTKIYFKPIHIDSNIIIQFSSIIIGVLLIVTTEMNNAKQSSKIKQQQIYQQLELASIDLFRFEVDHPDLVACIWAEPNTRLPTSSSDLFQLDEYIAQPLNLFEMAVSFRHEEIMPANVFGSWVVWIYDLCCSENFAKRWSETLRFNYVKRFRQIIHQGIILSRTDPENGNIAFFEYMAEEFDCAEIKCWLEECEVEELSLKELLS